MKVAVAWDHRGVENGRRMVEDVRKMGHEVEAIGPETAETPVDYPDIAFQACLKVAEGGCDRAILLCGSGIGVSIAANKVPAIRAALCHNTYTAEISRRHNNANVLCLGSKLLDSDLMVEMARIWLATEFEGGRHEIRVKKILDFESAER